MERYESETLSLHCTRKKPPVAPLLLILCEVYILIHAR